MLKAFISTITILILDAIWLGLVSKKIYITEIGALFRASQGEIQILWIPAILVYAILVIGILVFVIPKSNFVPLSALGWGALFGFITYAVYDFTNLATLSGWTLKISIIDILWGMTLCGITSFVTVLVCRS